MESLKRSASSHFALWLGVPLCVFLFALGLDLSVAVPLGEENSQGHARSPSASAEVYRQFASDLHGGPGGRVHVEKDSIQQTFSLMSCCVSSRSSLASSSPTAAWKAPHPGLRFLGLGPLELLAVTASLPQPTVCVSDVWVWFVQTPKSRQICCLAWRPNTTSSLPTSGASPRRATPSSTNPASAACATSASILSCRQTPT